MRTIRIYEKEKLFLNNARNQTSLSYKKSCKGLESLLTF